MTSVMLQLVVAFALSVSAYISIYAAVVPEAGFEHTLHFGLCQPSVAPPANTESHAAVLPAVRVARLSFAEDNAPFYVAREDVSLASSSGLTTVAPPLAKGYEYSVDLCLNMPESQPNVDAGTFVASIRVVSEANASLLSVSRPLVLRYRSAQLSSLRTWFFIIPLLFGWMDEAQTLCAPLSDAFTNLRQSPAHRLTVALASPGACGMQIYSASLYFGVRLSGLPALMSRYVFASAVIGVGSLMVLHLVSILLFEVRPARTVARTGRAEPAEPVAPERAGGRARGVPSGRAPDDDARRRAAERQRQRDADAAAAAAAAAFLDDDIIAEEDEAVDDEAFYRAGDLHDGLRQRR